MIGYIYKHTSPSGKSYIGQTYQDPESRWKNGKRYLELSDTPFARAIKKYGWDNITHEIIDTIDFDNIKQLNQLEEDYILKFDTIAPNGYNLMTKGTSKVLSRQSIEKIAKSKVGDRLSAEELEKYIDEHFAEQQPMRKQFNVERQKRYRDKKRDELKVKGMEYYFANKEARDRYSKEYTSRPEVVEKRKEWSKEYVRKPEIREKHREALRRWRAKQKALKQSANNAI